ncbi:GNAT family N-acetyltransferase [Chryseobacterium sp. NEB161]|nr:GNAT family N-acetyltransferase [Chryseobacterium sp. NEB161]
MFPQKIFAEIMMDAIEIRSYKDEDFDKWNNFVSTAKNGTFLFRRDFMDYHKDRFDDFSLLIYNNLQLVAILPGHLKNNEFHSHQGLTYGGILISQDLRMTVFFDIVSEVLRFLCEKDIPFFYWKEIPYFYNQFPSDEWKYLMFITNAELYRRDLCSVVDLKRDYYTSKSVVRYVKSSEKSGIYYKKCDLWKEFWKEILEPELLLNHNTSPVHSLKEIMALKSKFENNIHLYGVFSDDKMLGGTVIFTDKNVAHAQYICVKTEYKDKKALNFLFHKLLSEEFINYDYFDFGISNEDNGRKLNKGLLFWKEGFGARGVSQDFYKISTHNYNLIEQMYV